MIAAVNGDVTGIESEARVAEVWTGLEALGPHLVPDFDSETGKGYYQFYARRCDSCGTYSAHCGGERWDFAILGED
jgi:hypothetical protein